jgi:cysteine desulfurase/selenocysteine lyase
MSFIARRCWRSAVDEITPDIVAQIASRIYNETQSVPTPPLQVDSVPATSVVANPAHAPAAARIVPMPSTGRASPWIPAAWPSLASTTAKPEWASKPHLASQSADLTGLGDASSLPWREDKPAAQSSEGLAAFVRGVRQVGIASPDAPVPDSTWRNRQPFFATPSLATGGRPFDVASIRKEFPILRQHVNGRPLAWFDNAATTQKPQCVIDAISRFYENDNSNIHRGAHTLAARATDAYEAARRKVQAFLGAASVKEIVFARGTTEAINLIANTFGRKFLSPGDEIVLSTLEHHANIVPWQLIAKEKGAVIRVIPVNDRGEILLEEYQRLLGPRTKLVAITQASNSLGTILPVGEMTQVAKRYGARVLIDGAQSVAHIPVNVQDLGADFFVFSGHKIFAPTGIGVAYIKQELHDILPPWQGGGNMIRNVTFEETTFSEAPAKFEAGTPNIADAVGLGAALDFVSRLGLSNIAAYEHELLEYATHGLAKVNGLRLIGTAREKVGVLSFVLPHMRTEDVGRQLDQEGIAVRSGHHCSQPSLRRFGVETTVRPSLSLYNTNEEIDRLVEALQRITRRGV